MVTEAVVWPVTPGPDHKYGPAVLDVNVAGKQDPVRVIVGKTGSVTLIIAVAVPPQVVTDNTPVLPAILFPCHNTEMLPVPWPVVMVPKLLVIAQV